MSPLGILYDPSDVSGRGYDWLSRVALCIFILHAKVHTFAHVSCPFLFHDCFSVNFSHARGGRLTPSERGAAWDLRTVRQVSSVG